MNALDLSHEISRLNEDIQTLDTACKQIEGKGTRAIPHQVLSEARTEKTAQRNHFMNVLRQIEVPIEFYGIK